MAVVASLPGFEPHAACVAPPAAQSERLARLRLARSENVGPRSFLHLIERFGTAVVALDALPDLAAAGGRRGYVVCPTAAAEDEVLTGEAAGASLVLLGDAAYPARLLSIGSPPPALWMLGDPGVLTAPAVAVVGARNASALGLRQARRLGQALAEAGQLVVSGLARGIDHAAHEGALAAAGPGASTTVAVLPGGIDRVYPEEHLPLVRRIADAGGAVIAEAPPGTEPRSRHFPRRNRLVSGLSDGVVIVEAAERSGSLITARSALDQGREVMACPGAPEDPRAAGCNSLIREGAALIRDLSDVLEALEPLRSRGFSEGTDAFDFGGSGFDAAFDTGDDFEVSLEEGGDDAALAEQVIALLGAAPVEIDEIARLTGAAPAQLSLVLLELDLAGRVDVLPGGLVAERRM